MRWVRRLAFLLLPSICGIAFTSCEREERNFQVTTPAADAPEAVPVRDAVRPGGTGEATPPVNPPIHLAEAANQPFGSQFPENAQALAEGQTLYVAFNCVGCHANGGGGIGPPLLDNKWFYGSEPNQVYQTIVGGRPNGMPSFRGRIPDFQVWELVAYVRSLSGLANPNAAPGRTDHMKAEPPQNSMPAQLPKVIPEPTTQPVKTTVTGLTTAPTTAPATGPATAPTEAPPP